MKLTFRVNQSKAFGAGVFIPCLSFLRSIPLPAQESGPWLLDSTGSPFFSKESSSAPPIPSSAHDIGHIPTPLPCFRGFALLLLNKCLSADCIGCF